MISSSMTLPELVEAAEDMRLNEEERDYLIILLKAYAEDILKIGQCVELGSVVIAKTIQGQVSVRILK